jgi:Polyketide cyclase / dehydrase and lipid transport
VRHVRTSVLVAARIDLVFDLARDVRTHIRGLAGLRARAVEPGVTHGRLGAGDLLSLRARHLGRTWRYDARVTVCEPPGRLVVVQEAGPFRSMRHETRFTQTGAGTLLLDELSWSSGAGPAGAAVDALLRRVLRRLLLVRDAHLRMVAEQLAAGAEPVDGEAEPVDGEVPGHVPGGRPQPPAAVHIPARPPSRSPSPAQDLEAGGPPGRGNVGLPPVRAAGPAGAGGPLSPPEPLVVVAVALVDDRGRVLAAERPGGG